MQDPFSLIIGRSPSLLAAIELARRVAETDATVLIHGESGSGKELMARAIHAASKRAEGPFIPVNCASIPETLLESELFGFKEGAFTGATRDHKGKFLQSHKGTLFLDEIGDLSLSAQAKILRALQEQEIDILGGQDALQVDVRIIAATNKDLERMVQEGNFRNDLYYRLNEVVIEIPPLRERRDDIPLLINHFIEEFNQALGKSVKGISEAALSYLMRYDWPGNVRELKNVIKRAMIMIDGDMLWLEHLPIKVEMEDTDSASLLSLAEVERRHIEKVLRACKWNKSRAARVLGISRPRLDRKIKAYNLTPDPASSTQILP